MKQVSDLVTFLAAEGALSDILGVDLSDDLGGASCTRWVGGSLKNVLEADYIRSPNIPMQSLCLFLGGVV